MRPCFAVNAGLGVGPTACGDEVRAEADVGCVCVQRHLYYLEHLMVRPWPRERESHLQSAGLG